MCCAEEVISGIFLLTILWKFMVAKFKYKGIILYLRLKRILCMCRECMLWRKEEVKKGFKSPHCCLRISENFFLFRIFLFFRSTFPFFGTCAKLCWHKVFSSPTTVSNPTFFLRITSLLCVWIKRNKAFVAVTPEKKTFFAVAWKKNSSEQWQCKFLFNSSMSKQAKLMIHFH